MRASMQKRKGTPCDICGDVGYWFLLTTCIECQKTHEHIYCMRKNLNQVPEIWCCEACQPHNKDLSPPNSFEKVSHGKKESSYSALSNVTHQDNCRSGAPGTVAVVQALSKKQKMTSTANCFSKELGVSKKNDRPKSKVKYLAVEDIYKLSSGANTILSPLKGGFNTESSRTSTVSACATSLQKVHTSKSPKHSKSPMLGSTQIERQTSRTSHQLLCQNSPAHVPSKNITSENSRKRKTEVKALVKPQPGSSNVLPLTKVKQSDSDVHHFSSNPIGSVPSKESGDRELLGMDKNAGKEVCLVLSDRIKKEDPFDALARTSEDGNLTNPPATEAAWKGNIKILDIPATLDEVYDRFEAHHPCQISQKAYEFCKGMPGTLQFILRPRFDVWVEIFKKGPPSEYDIALYFFPGDFYRSRKKYEKLQKLIETDDLCLRSCIGSVELLIFTSQQLPADSQKLDQHFYLWGVFRSMKRRFTSISLKENEQINDVSLLKYRNDLDSKIVLHGNRDEFVDMNVDMIGGKDVARVDKVVRLSLSDHLHKRGEGNNSFADHTNGDRISNVHSDRSVEKATTAHPGLKVKIEHHDGLDAPSGYQRPLICPPGFSKPITALAAQKCHMEKLLDAYPGGLRPFTPPPGFSRPVSGDADQNLMVKKQLSAHPAYQGSPAVPPGFSRPVFNVKMEPTTHPFNVPPGFSNSVGRDERDFLPEVHRSEDRSDTFLNVISEKNESDKFGSCFLAYLIQKHRNTCSVEDEQQKANRPLTPRTPGNESKPTCYNSQLPPSSARLFPNKVKTEVKQIDFEP